MASITQERTLDPRTPDGGPLISVIIPYNDPRGEAQNLATWTREQTLAGDRFEVIALTNNPDPAFTTDLQRHLRPQDRLLHVESSAKLTQHAIGIDAAKGSLLLLTEDHCLADPDCLAAMERYFAKSGNNAATLRWGNIARTEVARMEALLSKTDYKIHFEDQGQWNRVRVRGFALRRKVYDDVGGIDRRYGEFSEVLLAAKLHERQYRIGFAPEAGVQHVDTYTLKDLRVNARDYAWHQCAYCAENDPESCERYFDTPRTLSRATAFPADVGRWFARAAWRLFITRGDPRWAGLAMSSRYATILGVPTRRARSRLALLTARLRYEFWWFSDARRLRAFQDYWDRAAQSGRVDYIATHAGRIEPQPQLRHLTAEQLHGRDIFGAYSLEHYAGLSFRWTAGAAMMLLDLVPGDYRITIDTGGLRGKGCKFPLGLFWNDHLLPDGRVRRGDGRISFTVTRDLFAAGPQRLTVVAAPRLPSLKEPRLLGLPICAIHIEHDGSPTHE